MGRMVFGIAALALGIAALVLHDQLISNWQLAGVGTFIVVTSIAQIVGGAAIAFERTSSIGAVILGAVYLVFSLTLVPDVVAQPGVYANWGDVFYQLALVAGAMAVYGMRRSAAVLFGACNISFAIEQVEFLARTVSLVPSWIPGAMFWAIATAVAFAAGGAALIAGYRPVLASRLLALMLGIFGVAIWIPILIADPKTHSNWSEGLETFAIAAAGWTIADYLSRRAART